VHARLHLACDVGGPELLKERQARRHSGEILERQGDLLEPARVVTPGHVVREQP